jgi:hypothetical protein
MYRREKSVRGGDRRQTREVGRSVPERRSTLRFHLRLGGPGRTALPIAVRTLPAPDEIDPALPGEECAPHLPTQPGARREFA